VPYLSACLFASLWWSKGQNKNNSWHPIGVEVRGDSNPILSLLLQTNLQELYKRWFISRPISPRGQTDRSQISMTLHADSLYVMYVCSARGSLNTAHSVIGEVMPCLAVCVLCPKQLNVFRLNFICGSNGKFCRSDLIYIRMDAS